MAAKSQDAKVKANSELIQIAITGRENRPTEWLEPVTDEEYNKR